MNHITELACLLQDLIKQQVKRLLIGIKSATIQVIKQHSTIQPTSLGKWLSVHVRIKELEKIYFTNLKHRVEVSLQSLNFQKLLTFRQFQKIHLMNVCVMKNNLQVIQGYFISTFYSIFTSFTVDSLQSILYKYWHSNKLANHQYFYTRNLVAPLHFENK